MRLFYNILFAFVIILSLSSCAIAPKQPRLADIARDYFEVYAKRSDFERFMSFYDDKASFNDIIYGVQAKNKTEIARFLDWHQGQFKLDGDSSILTVTGQFTDGNTVITRGHFHPFYFNDKPMGPWLFVIILEFNDNNKIIRQTDWINYTPRQDFLGGADMNQQLLVKPK